VKLPVPPTTRLRNDDGPEAEAECVMNSVSEVPKSPTIQYRDTLTTEHH
jgi:hypothetical protein